MTATFVFGVGEDTGAGAARALRRSQAPRRGGACAPQPRSLGGRPS
jgi:hypothetical protein